MVSYWSHRLWRTIILWPPGSSAFCGGHATSRCRCIFWPREPFSLGGGFRYFFILPPILREMMKFDEHWRAYVSNRWFNHQIVFFASFFVRRFGKINQCTLRLSVYSRKHPYDYTVPHWINPYTRHGLWGAWQKIMFFFRTPDPIFLTLPLHFENHASFGTSPDWFPKCVGRSVGSGDAKSATGRIFWIQAEMFAWIVNLGEHHCKLHTMMFFQCAPGSTDIAILGGKNMPWMSRYISYWQKTEVFQLPAMQVHKTG